MFPGPGSNTYLSSDLSHSSDNAGSLTCCATREVQDWLILYVPTTDAIISQNNPRGMLVKGLREAAFSVALEGRRIELPKDRFLPVISPMMMN